MNKKNKKMILWTLSAVIIILIVFVIASIVYVGAEYKSFTVTGPAMTPTLQNGEKIIASKKTSNIQRYDIVIFENGSTELVKRVIGLPGDHVVITNSKVTIYNTANPNGFNPDSNQIYLAPFITTSGNINLTVPQNEYYVLGDNRLDSLDSRYFGPISKTKIIAIYESNVKFSGIITNILNLVKTHNNT